MDTIRDAQQANQLENVMSAKTKYAKTAWCVADVHELREQMELPKITNAQAEEWLADNAKHIEEAAIQAGWAAMECLL